MHYMKISILAALTALVCAGCPSTPVPNPPPGPDADAAPDIPDIPGDADAASNATCSSWCKHAAALKCPSAAPTKAGATCVEVCTNVQSGPVKFNLRCRSTAKTCALADSCE